MPLVARNVLSNARDSVGQKIARESMRTLKTAQKDGKRIVTIELDHGEHLLVVRDDAYYRLGVPLDDQTMPAHVLANAVPVYWCPIEQDWVNAK